MEAFKQCSQCGYLWDSREAFLGDAGVWLIGYQPCYIELKTGLFLFNHRCGATLAITVEPFAEFYDGPVFQERRTGSADCPGHCFYPNNLQKCPTQCECAYVREIMQAIRNFKNFRNA